MANRLIGIYDGNTGEYIEREATDAEQAQIEKNELELAAKELEEQTKAARIRATQISAYEKLGLTAEEIEVLLPTPKALIRE
jgi:hypothetical protein